VERIRTAFFYVRLLTIGGKRLDLAWIRRIRRPVAGCAALILPLVFSLTAFAQIVTPLPDTSDGSTASVYVSMDSWVYPAFSRLQALGYADSAFAGLRPWTRKACLNILEETQKKIERAPDSPGNEEATELFNALSAEFRDEITDYDPGGQNLYGNLDRLYSRQQYMSGATVNDSYHFGQTLVNDSGRPYQQGYNQYSGLQAHAQYVRFALDVRGEIQNAPGRAAYPLAAEQMIALTDQIPQPPDIPAPAVNDFRLLNANLSFNIANWDFSVGKSEDWWGPDQGSAMAWSTNAEPIYALRINRTEPLMIPILSKFLGPFRFEGLFGELQQIYPRNPWVHAEKINFKPTPNLEFGFSRVVVFAGEDTVPLTFGSFWHSFTSFQNVPSSEKFSRNDPGARHSSFDFSYRLPFVRNWLTLYTDSIVHDDVSPIDAPRHAAVNPGIYLSHFPGAPKLDLRVEAANTAVSNPQRNFLGQYFYWEVVYRQVYTNKGYLFGSWIGRESKGGQAWLTYWLNPESRLILGYRNAKASANFITGGTTQNDFNVQAIVRVKQDLELNAFAQYERWTIPILKPGPQNQFTGSVQLTWYPKLSIRR
jgi:hypothetical protein